MWVLAFFVALPAMLVAKVHKNGWCGGSWPSKIHKEAYIIALLVMKCLLPLSIIIVAYIRIGLYVKETRLPVPPATANPSTAGLKNQAARENIDSSRHCRRWSFSLLSSLSHIRSVG